MTREIRRIPPAPRCVRWRAVLWHWWPVAFVGFMLGVYGGLITLMTSLAALGKQGDDVLITAQAETAPGRVEKIDQDGRGAEPMRLSYSFVLPGGQVRRGRCFVNLPGIGVGDEVEVEYARSAPHVSRIRGGRISLGPPLHRVFFWTLLLPGLVALGLWACAVLRLRHLLRTGDVAVADLRAVEPLRFIVPTMLRVTYSYRDHHAREHVASHWVRARSALGERIGSEPAHVPVVLGRSGRGVSRLVLAADFVSEGDEGRRSAEDLPHGRRPGQT